MYLNISNRERSRKKRGGRGAGGRANDGHTCVRCGMLTRNRSVVAATLRWYKRHKVDIYKYIAFLPLSYLSYVVIHYPPYRIVGKTSDKDKVRLCAEAIVTPIRPYPTAHSDPRVLP